VQGATVTVSLANNSGVPAGAEIIGGPYVTSEPTKEDGIAHLSLAVNKAGGYTFYATAVLSLGGATNSAFSTTVLNIKNAKP